MEDPRAGLSSLEQARRFSVSIIGPLQKACVRDTLAYLGFERVGGEFKKEAPGKHVLSAGVYQQFGANYILIYNLTKLLAWRNESKTGVPKSDDTLRQEFGAPPVSCRLPACQAIGPIHSRCPQHLARGRDNRSLR